MCLVVQRHDMSIVQVVSHTCPPKVPLSFLLGIQALSNTWFLVGSESAPRPRQHLSSAIFAELTVVTSRLTMLHGHDVCSSCLHLALHAVMRAESDVILCLS